MNAWRPAFVSSLLFCSVLFVDLSTAQAQMRTWTAVDGSQTLEAEFVRLDKGNIVVLRSKAGEVLQIPLVRLSAADGDYIRLGVTKPGVAVEDAPAQPPSDPQYDHPPLSPKLAAHLRVCLQTKQTADVLSEEATTKVDFFRELPADAGVLLGFDITYGPMGNGSTVHTIRSYAPIYLTTNGKVSGAPRGYKNSGQAIHIEAKPGYAVGKIQVCRGSFVDAIILTYMKLTPRGLDPTDAYDSRAYGRPVPVNVRPPVGGDGSLIVGIHGTWRRSGYVYSLGIITAPASR